eukprot:1953785-Pyramimonas_sp.AAC.1
MRRGRNAEDAEQQRHARRRQSSRSCSPPRSARQPCRRRWTPCAKSSILSRKGATATWRATRKSRRPTFLSCTSGPRLARQSGGDVDGVPACSREAPEGASGEGAHRKRKGREGSQLHPGRSAAARTKACGRARAAGQEARAAQLRQVARAGAQ